MSIILTAISVAVLCLLIAIWIRRTKGQDDLEKYTITPEALYRLFVSNKQVLLFDVRQPLDLLTNSEIIPGAKRIPPKDLRENPELIPKEEDSVVYCTCPGDKTSREILHQARALNFSRVKFLKGGLAAWKAKGYPVEPYTEPFHLDTATSLRSERSSKRVPQTSSK